MTDDTWESARLTPEQLSDLAQAGHFSHYESELAWTPRFVMGHLRDSAVIFTSRIQAIMDQDNPFLPDFVTDDPVRLARYSSLRRGDLEAQLEEAQHRLLRTVAAVPEDHLSRAGMHAVDGIVTLDGLLTFLPSHQRDHATQIETLAQNSSDGPSTA